MGDNPKYRMGLNETAIGMTPPLWLMAMCEDTVGSRDAQRLLQLGEMLSPQGGRSLGTRMRSPACVVFRISPACVISRVRDLSLPHAWSLRA